MGRINTDKMEFKISYSRINAYLFCPQKYKLIYIDGIKQPVTGDISFGHSIHGALEKYHLQENGDFEFLMQCYNESWKPGGFKGPLDTFEYYLRGKTMLENYFKSLSRSGGEVLYVEKKFEANIGKYKFIGIIDRIDKTPGGYEIIDYKTHSQIWTQDRIDRDLQISFYMYACKIILGIAPKTASVYFLSENKKIQTKRSQQDIQEAIETALNCAQRISQEDFTPNTLSCPQCGFKEKCGKRNKHNDI